MSGSRKGMTLSSAAMRRAAWFFAMIPAICFLSSCAAVQPAATIPRPSISWPLASEHNRIAWIKSIAGPADLGIGKGFWQRMLEVVSGEEGSAIVRPYGVLRTAAGQIYLADPGGGRVHCLDIVKGNYSIISGQDDSPLPSPIGLTEDDTGRLYITDSITGMVYRFDPKDGSLKPLLSKALERPTGIAFHALNKLLYVADTKASQIVVLDQNGVERRRMGSRGEGIMSFNRPTDLAIDARGQIYVTDSLNFRITVLTPEGQVVRQFGAPGDSQGYFSRPKGVAVDSVGNIYVSDSLRDAIQVFDKNGAPQLVFGGKGEGPGQFWLPSGIFIDRNDWIYVADTYNRRIQVFRFLSNGFAEDAGEEAGLFEKSLSTPH
jgi:DNA-binding beta-propeller fold protein YncE